MRRLSTVCSRSISICICIEVGKRESIREVQRITTFCVHNLWESLFFSFLFFSIDFSGCVLYFTFHHLNTKASNAKQLAFNLRLASLIHFSLANALIISQCSGSNWCCQSHIFIAQVMAKTLSSHLCYKKKKKKSRTLTSQNLHCIKDGCQTTWFVQTLREACEQLWLTATSPR